jgi:hypothetical protein
MSVDKHKIVAGVAQYVLANSPQTYEQLTARAVDKKWYTEARWTKIIDALSKHPQISVKVTDDLEVIFRQKQQRATRPKAKPPQLPPYPRKKLGVSPFKVCFCAIWRADDREIYDAEKHGHRPTCDAVVYADEWQSQYRGRIIK